MIPCTFRQLEIFVAAAEDCHFSRTANRLGITQAAVSHHILELEERLGKALFVRRRGSTPILSTDGAVFLKQSRLMLNVGETMCQAGSIPERRPVTRIKVGAGAHVLDDYIKPSLHRFHQCEPDVLIECVLVQTCRQGLQLARSGAVDLLAFTSDRPSADKMHAEVIRTIRFGLYASPDFAAHRSASAQELSGLPFILPDQGMPQDKIVHDALMRVGVWCENVVARAQFTDVMIELALSGLGIVPLFETMVEKRVAAGELIKFDLELPALYRMIFRLDREPTPELRKVAAFVRDILA